MTRNYRIYVDYRASLSLVGTVCKYIALPLSLPLGVAVVYGESVLPFVVAVAVAIAGGTALERLDPDPEVGHREGLLVVSLAWLFVPLLGTVPYLVAGQGTVATPANALFESMSGFTTTGATVLDDISFATHSRSILMWRQLTQWLGGLGIIVMMVAILPQLSVGGAQLIREEAPGIDVEKLTPHIRETARLLWTVYIALTVAAVAVYYGLNLAGLAENMDLYNAVAHAFTTLPTGGFSPEGRSIEAFSPAIQWVMIPFMIVAGTNFALLWHVSRGRPRRLTRNGEFRTYLLALAALGVLLAALLYVGEGLAYLPEEVAPIAGDVEHALRQAFFQAAAIVTTTGYASMDFDAWSAPAKVALLFAMFLGGSAGSAAGSIKIVRWYAIGKAARRELFTSVHPEAVRPLRTSGEIIDEETLSGLFVFTLLFLAIFALGTMLLFLDAIRTPGLDLDAMEALSASAATIGNVGPGFGVVGPMGNYEPFSTASKLLLVFLMWIGRLEILSVLVILTPSYWRR
ncbi:TrkH family potassium uptake protein [Salinilacihabitans rarus]|uniref:TrkH family potassium uptake protein n=1 Tax=Salinilacihabitans rarus TaxID=2961596 RepID=UPI0020C84779|nr:TrkH family potassium uptake protein [Salinilacihabitans rarus]